MPLVDIGNYKVVDNYDRVIHKIQKDMSFSEWLGKFFALFTQALLLYLCAKTFLNHLPITIDHTLYWSLLGILILIK